MAGDDQSEDRPTVDYGDVIDSETFDQILEMDDDDDSFSRQIVYDFFEQAASTFERMDEALVQKDMKALSDLGHFLKGSSATLGLIKVKDGCEKIQHWGSGMDEHGSDRLDKDSCLRLIAEELPPVKADCANAERRLKRYYELLAGVDNTS